MREAQIFCEQLTKRDFHLGALVLNKTLPDYLLSPEGARAADALAAEAGPLAELLAGTGKPELTDVARTTRVLRTIGESFKNFAVVAKREAELKTELSAVPDVVVNVPNFEVDIYDVSGLARIGDCLFEP